MTDSEPRLTPDEIRAKKIETEFTPGPWDVHTVRRSIIYGPSPYSDQSQRAIAKTYSGMGASEELANATLIAAAPELYEACQYIVDAGETGDEATAILKAVAALKKARGES